MIFVPAAQDVESWFLVFHPRCGSNFWQRVVPGRFKHVRAFAWAESVRVWVFYDVWFTGGARVTLAPGGEIGDALVGQYVEGAAVLKMRRGPERFPPLSTLVGFWCVPAVRRLVNLPGGALRPDALWRDCLAHGAEIVIHELPDPPAGPGAGTATAASAAPRDAANPDVARAADGKPVVAVRPGIAA
ncbi:MAG: hypothetical protein KGJ45_11630 [Elusimicrobia bacterium]|nr:hypothetical protein [Elusimicrobiota bacterium]